MTGERPEEIAAIQKQIDDLLNECASHESHNTVFRDWVELMACAIRANIMKDPAYEEQYQQVAKKYTKDQIAKFHQCYALLVSLFDHEINDWLGNIFMSSGAGDTKSGQFFAPFQACELAAALTEPTGQPPFFLMEPTCGAGGMLLASIKKLASKGINFQQDLNIEANDIDPHCVRMCYVQLSIIGAAAKITLGNALYNECLDTWLTPMYVWRRCDF